MMNNNKPLLERSKKVLAATVITGLLTFSVAGVPWLGNTPKAYATEVTTPTTHTISGDDFTIGTYKLIKIFAGDFTGKKAKSGLTYADDTIKTAVVAAISAYREAVPGDTTKDPSVNEVKATDTADKAAEAIANMSNPKLFSNLLAKELATKNVVGTEITVTDTGTAGDNLGTLTTAALSEEGYYLIALKALKEGLDTGKKEITEAILVPFDNKADVTINKKADTPTLTKKIKDGDANTWDVDYKDIADGGIVSDKKPGEEGGVLSVPNVNYQLKGTVADNIASYKTYYYQFTDTMPTGFTTTTDEVKNNWNVSVYAQDASNHKITFAETTDYVTAVSGTTTSIITWTFADLKKSLADKLATTSFKTTPLADFDIYVEYTPVYDATDIQALYGSLADLSKPQVNTANLTFSNNPTSQGTGETDTTPDDETRLYDYNLKILKKDSTGAALTGAKFTLTNADGKTVGKELAAANDGTFTFTGLEADVVYTITETTVPTGYKAIEPIKFKITPVTNKESNGREDEDNDLTAGETKADAVIQYITVAETEDPSKAADVKAEWETVTVEEKNKTVDEIKAAKLAGATPVTKATALVTIVNTKDSELPLTGRQGIALGIVVGGLILGFSAVAIIRNRREEQLNG